MDLLTAPQPIAAESELHHRQHGNAQKASAERYATERRSQLTVLLVFAAAILLFSVLHAGVHNVFLPNWWHIDLP